MAAIRTQRIRGVAREIQVQIPGAPACSAGGMKKAPFKKLALTAETTRNLTAAEMRSVGGGLISTLVQNVADSRTLRRIARMMQGKLR